MYHLAPYKGRQSRLSCPACNRPHCFSPYVDDEGNVLDPTVGRCDHESSCAYHKTPAEYFREHPDLRPNARDWREAPAWLRKSSFAGPDRRISRQIAPSSPTQKDICTLPEDMVRKTIRLRPESNLITFLHTLFPDDIIRHLIQTYWLGVTRDLGTIFYQIDAQGRIRAGKIIRYNPETGHRIKDNTAKIPVDWVHTRLKRSGILPENWTLTQCLFGEHLLPQRPNDIVCLVEAEKTAVICAGFLPEFVWLATGGKGQLGDRLDALYGRRVIAYPDVDAFPAWDAKLQERPWLSILVSNYLEITATPEERASGADIADRLIAFRNDSSFTVITDQFVIPGLTRNLQAPALSLIQPIHPIQAIQERPEVAALIDDLGLELKHVTYIKPQENENLD